MKFIVSVVNEDDALPLVDVLVTNGYRVTTFKTAGGFLRKENVTLFTGVEDEQVEEVIRLIASGDGIRGVVRPDNQGSGGGWRGDLRAGRCAILKGVGQIYRPVQLDPLPENPDLRTVTDQAKFPEFIPK